MKNAERKIKKLKKSRLWPSILVFLLSLIGGALLLAAELSIYVSYVVETKYAQSLSETANLAQGIDTRMELGEDLQTAFDQTVKTANADQVALYDENGNLLVWVGDITVDMSQKIVLDIGFEEEVYLDLDTTEQYSTISIGKWKKTLGEYRDSFEVLAAMISSRVRTKGNLLEKLNPDNMRESMLEMEYWQPVMLSDGVTQLVSRRLLSIQRDDIIYGVIITAMSGFMFLLIFSAQFMNVVRQFRSRHRIEKLLTLDSITGGKNWIAFCQKASTLLSRWSRSRRTFAVVELSMIKYQSYCSLYGAKAGEKLLTGVDRILSDSLGHRETFGHVSGEDFALLLDVGYGDNCRQKTLERLEHLLDACRSGKNKSAALEGIDNSMLVYQAGVYFVEPGQKRSDGGQFEPSDISELYADAAIANASISQEEGTRVACFDQKMLEDQLWQHRVENTMQAALDNEEFQVYVQPKYDPNTGMLLGGEALVRWLSPTDGMISPGKFVPIFEKTGFVTRLDDYMISHVAKLQSQWLSQGKQIVPISVNVSRSHFAQPDLAEHICELVDVYHVPHESIEIELTESAFFDDKKALLTIVRKLQGYGFEVSMDDFGSGYSSLNSLKDLPLDVLKLDADFFRGDDFNTRGEIVVGKAISLAKQLNMKIVAEGVEKKEQVDFLAKQGCDMIQGYYFAKPMPAEEYAQRLK